MHQISIKELEHKDQCKAKTEKKEKDTQAISLAHIISSLFPFVQYLIHMDGLTLIVLNLQTHYFL